MGLSIEKKSLTQDLLNEMFWYVDGGLYWRVRPASRINIGDRFGSIEPSGYRRGSLFSKSYREHRLIWIFHNGDIPEGIQVDHINHDRSDNRIENLRLVTNKENARNKSAEHYKSERPFRGVRASPSGKFYVEFNMYDGYKYLGTFDTLEEAIAKRLEAEKENGFHENHLT